MKLAKILLSSTLLFSLQSFGAINPNAIKNELLKKYALNYSDTRQMAELKAETLNYGGQSVEALIEVMKNGKYPEKNRWVATFLLGQIMGDKSAPFIAKFTKHPNWIMRMASLKTLLALKQDKFGGEYARLLTDESLIVRTQALENIKTLKLQKYSANVWSMLYDRRNYYEPTVKGAIKARKRSNIIKNVIATIGELKFQDARAPLIKMVQKDKYNDIFSEMDLALTAITGHKSPNGDIKAKRLFWNRKALDVTIM
ncbi:MAG: HEAT repeat domain-containing protein [Bacteriovoracaceae bacterium]|nr:HEAT repeat domain-containing protein [Bacteriovoracaceae bacterium]